MQKSRSYALENPPPVLDKNRFSKRMAIWYNGHHVRCKNGSLRGEKNGLSDQICENRALPPSARVAVTGASIRLRILKDNARALLLHKLVCYRGIDPFEDTERSQYSGNATSL